MGRIISEYKYPLELIEDAGIVYKDGKYYYRKAHYELKHYSYEEVKHELIDLPDKLPDIRRLTT